MDKIKKIIFPLSFWFLNLSTPRAFADDLGDVEDIRLINPIGCDRFDCVADRIINLLMTIAIPLTAILVLVGGYQILTAGGDPEKFSTGKKTILYSAIGFVVVLSAKGVVAIIRNTFT